MRTVKTGCSRCFSRHHACNIFWQRIEGNLHFRHDITATSPTRVCWTLQDEKESRQDPVGQSGKELWQNRGFIWQSTAVDCAALLHHWQYVYARSLGCVGVLKEWLVRATALALREGSAALTLSHLERRALSEAKCARMAADIQEGEQALHYSEAHRQRLLALLGMSDMPSLTSGTASPIPLAELARAESRVAPPPPSVRPRVGQRRPHRDPVGALDPPATPTKCLGAGTLDVDARGLTQAAITQVECPVCGAVRTVQLKAQRVLLPAHAPLKTRTTCKGARWIKGETGWALAQP
jgi:hypothetical protein